MCSGVLLLSVITFLSFFRMSQRQISHPRIRKESPRPLADADEEELLLAEVGQQEDDVDELLSML
jgi:hypothetical protein